MENSNNTKKIVCKSCGAEFDDALSSCPYCSNTNINGAEMEYMGKLEDIREDVSDLKHSFKNETKKELVVQSKKTIRLVIILLIIVVAFFVIGLAIDELPFISFQTEEQKNEEIIFHHETIPKLNELYEAGKYGELIDLYYDDLKDNEYINSWKHSDFFFAYYDVLLFRELSMKDNLNDFDKEDLIYLYVSIENREMDVDEKEIINDFQKDNFMFLNTELGVTVDDINSIINEKDYDKKNELIENIVNR